MSRPPVEPVAWKPPRSPGLEGPYSANTRLLPLERWETGGVGPEDVAIAGDGTVYTGTEDGRILRFPPGGGAYGVVAETGGRPLGIEVHSEGWLVVCDADRGLLRADPDGRVTVMADSHQGEPFRFTNNAAIAADGTIYFTVSSRRFGIADYMADLMEHSATGRLFALDPGGDLRLLVDGLAFANGVALAPDESFVLFAETGAYRINRLWLSGARAGEQDVFVDNLPGFPDNMSTGPDGTFWVALPTPRNPMLDLMLPFPKLRRLAWRLPENLQPKAAEHGFVLGFDAVAAVAHNLQDPTGAYSMTTSAREHDGWLYVGTLTGTAIGRVKL